VLALAPRQLETLTWICCEKVLFSSTPNVRPYHKFLQDKFILPGASWEETGAGRRHNPLSYALQSMTIQTKET
jgi:hypothetical protein